MQKFIKMYRWISNALLKKWLTTQIFNRFKQNVINIWKNDVGSV